MNRLELTLFAISAVIIAALVFAAPAYPAEVWPLVGRPGGLADEP